MRKLYGEFTASTSQWVPQAMAPPLIFTISGFNSSLRITASDWEAKLHWVQTGRSVINSPACFNTFGTASTGPIPCMIRGWTPGWYNLPGGQWALNPVHSPCAHSLPQQKQRHHLFEKNYRQLQLPPAAKAGFNLANPSTEVSALNAFIRIYCKTALLLLSFFHQGKLLLHWSAKIPV